MSVSRPTGVQLVLFFQYSNDVVGHHRDLQVSQQVVPVEFAPLLHCRHYL